ncbi:hypothetical protein F1559_000266 [Cyanidiococcus yangmingshanensis]|uniref:Pre-mRNA-splicing factor 18 n=1 Tax=Cyanidiococcus yangmingshanensis TaxID=2690220 RepID=A0A7J7IE75_9RHOD|nr:hypothetical protein F1559_000266 [Cyanidiococcus yangmingshanensis]
MDLNVAIDRMLEEVEGFASRKCDLQGYAFGEHSPERFLKQVQRLVHALKRQDFIEAENIYMQVAMGSENWSMGLPETGIHKRRARKRLRAETRHHPMENRAMKRVYMH